MWDAAREDRDATGPKGAVLPVDVQEDLTVEHVERLVRTGMQVQRRGLAAVEMVLKDNALRADRVHQLALAVRSAVGIESLFWLTHVAGLSRDQASEVMQWSARALLHHALAEGLYDARLKPKADVRFGRGGSGRARAGRR